MSDPTNEAQSPAELRDYAERQKAAAEAAQARVATLEAENRQNALLAAGVDPASPVGAMFAKAYDGDLKVDAIKEEWAKIAPATPTPAAPADDGPTAEELAAARASAALNTGATPPGEEPTPHPNVAAKNAYDAIRAQGGSKARADTAYLQTIMDAAAAGDERVANVTGRFEAP